jgi:hypothetical protein
MGTPTEEYDRSFEGYVALMSEEMNVLWSFTYCDVKVSLHSF